MTALTGQEIVSELSTRLRARFSVKEIAEIYKDKPVQSMKTPCIFIHSIETTHTPQMRKYAQWDFILDIRCHPSRMSTNIHTWARGLAVMILDVVEHLQVSGQRVKAKGATWRVEDDVLHVIVNYGFRVIGVSEDVPDMQTLAYGERIKS